MLNIPNYNALQSVMTVVALIMNEMTNDLLLLIEQPSHDITLARNHRVYISFFTLRLAIIIHVFEKMISKPILCRRTKALFAH